MWLERDSEDRRGSFCFGYSTLHIVSGFFMGDRFPSSSSVPLAHTGRGVLGILGRNYWTQRCLSNFIQVQHSRAVTQLSHPTLEGEETQGRKTAPETPRAQVILEVPFWLHFWLIWFSIHRQAKANKSADSYRQPTERSTGVLGSFIFAYCALGRISFMQMHFFVPNLVCMLVIMEYGNQAQDLTWNP